MVLSPLVWDHLTVDSSSSRVANSRKAARTRPITCLDTWLEAWSIYAGVRTSYNPELAPELFRYQTFITRASRRFKLFEGCNPQAHVTLKGEGPEL